MLQNLPRLGPNNVSGTMEGTMDTGRIWQLLVEPATLLRKVDNWSVMLGELCSSMLRTCAESMW